MAFRTNKMPVLQEKSASGSVASFNTALAMPLPSCNIAVNAWQEGSGDPSPSNVRPIHGFDKQNIYQRGVNLFDISAVERGKWVNLDTGAIENGSAAYYLTDYIPVKAGVNYTMKSAGSSRRWTYDVNKQPVSVISSDTFTPSVDGFVLITINELRLTDFYMTIGSTIQPKEPYTGNTYTIQLGQDVYGGVYNSVSGVLRVTHKFVEYSENDVTSPTPYVYNGMKGVIFRNIPDITYSPFPSGISNMSNRVGGFTSGAVWCGIGNDTRLFWIGILDILNMETIDEFKSWVADNHLQVVFELSERDKFDIQLTPTQIETLIGNNTIFADTGDIDLTYKDLDIAKRGNFREVFKLPS